VSDAFSPRKRSSIMSAVRREGGALERRLWEILGGLGVKFSRHRRDLAGSPDVVLAAGRIAVFVHGCFWHGHPGCRRAVLPKSHVKFWSTKIASNRRRDAYVVRKLRRGGYSVVTVWGCQMADALKIGRRIVSALSRASAAREGQAPPLAASPKRVPSTRVRRRED